MGTIDPKRVLVPVSLATGLSLLGDTALYTVLPTNAAVAGVAIASVGVLLSVNRFIRLFLNTPIGLLADRWPRRRVFVPAVFLGAISTGLYAMTVGFWPLLFGRLLWGVAWAGIWVSGNAIILDITKDHDRGRWVGRYHFAFFFGAASGAILGGILTDWLGYRGAMTVAASLTLGGALVALLMLPETGHLRSTRTLGSVDGSEQQPETNSDWGQLASVSALFGANRLVITGVLIATLSLFLSQRLGQSVEIAGHAVGITSISGLALGISTLIGMVAAPLGGSISDRLGTRWGVVSGGLVSSMAGFWLLSLGIVSTMFIGLPLVFIGSGSNQGLSTTMLGDLSQQARYGRRLGIFFTVGDLCSAIGPPLAYAFLPLIGLSAVYRLCVIVLGMMLLLAFRWTIRPRMRTAITG